MPTSSALSAAILPVRSRNYSIAKSRERVLQAGPSATVSSCLQTTMVQKRAADSDAESASSGDNDSVVGKPLTKKAKRLNRRKNAADEEDALLTSDFFELEVRLKMTERSLFKM